MEFPLYHHLFSSLGAVQLSIRQPKIKGGEKSTHTLEILSIIKMQFEERPTC